MRPIAYANTDVFLVCFSLVERKGLESAYQKWIAEVKSIAKECPCILVGTKLDLREELERNDPDDRLKDCVSSEEIKDAADEYGFQGYVECSTNENRNVNKVFHTSFKAAIAFRNIGNESIKINEKSNG